MTGDRTEFIGRNGSLAVPAALTMETLSNSVGAGPRSVRSASRPVILAPGETRSVVFLLGEGASIDEVRALIARCGDPEAVDQGRRTRPTRCGTTCSASIRSRRQTIRSTCWSTAGCCTRPSRRGSGRAPAIYQPGGAFGFRDQLQDVMALGFSRDRICTESTCCSPPAGSSSKATCSTGGTPRVAAAPARDAPTICCGCRTWRRTTSPRQAMTQVLDEVVPFLEAPPLPPDQHEVYDAARGLSDVGARCSTTASAPSITA